MNSRILISGMICLGEEVHVLLWYIDSVGDDQGSSSFGCRTALLLDLCQALVHDTSFAFRSCHSYIVSGIARSAGESLRLAKCVTSGAFTAFHLITAASRRLPVLSSVIPALSSIHREGSSCGDSLRLGGSNLFRSWAGGTMHYLAAMLSDKQGAA